MVAVLSLYSWAAVLAAYRLIAHQAVLRIRIHMLFLLKSCKNTKKNLDYYFVTLFDFLSLKNYVNVSSNSNKAEKIVLKN